MGKSEKLWRWFGLSYASFAILPRAMMHEMPEEWQDKMADLLFEWDETYVNQPDNMMLYATARNLSTRKFMKIPSWLLNYRRPDRDRIDSMKTKEGGE